ncbi:MAG TPA: hypothetical protein VEK11_20555 [Thermoanaerobaculia bacterium]|nr:hypothetical protein [Thermoanaerobaculia bacterium]
MLREGWVRLLVLGAAVFVMLVGASDPLRPLVIRTEQPRGAAPAECDEGLSPTPALRVETRELPLPEEIAPAPTTAAAVAAPPQGELRGALESVQNALARNNRPEFDEALVRTRLLVERYPTGGERRAAEELIRIYEGAGRLWEAQYQSPFFGEDSQEYAAVAAYPGYAEAVRRSMLTDRAGQKFYPAAESREFLTRVAAERLNRLGVRVSTPPARAARAEVTTPSTTTTQRRPSAAASPRRTAAASPRRAPSSRSAGTTTTPTRNRKPAATTSAPSTPNPSAPPTVAAVPVPAAPSVASPAAGDPKPAPADTAPDPADPAPAVASDPATGTTLDTDDTALDPALDTAPATATTAVPVTPPPDAPEPATEPARTRSIILPTILILIGLGVLIVLFRASK